MIGSVSTNRRAHAFAHLLDGSRLGEGPRSVEDEEATADGPRPGVRPESPADGAEAALLSLADRLSALPRPELSAETKTAQRARLVAAMEAADLVARGAPAEPGADRVPEQRGARGPRAARGGEGAPRGLPGVPLARLRPRSRLSKGLAAGGLTVGVAAGAFGGVAAASTDALPGDTLYGLKRGMEDLRLDFARGDVDRGRLYLDHAATRLGEAHRLLERDRLGRLDEESLGRIRRALASMRDDAAEGHRLLSQAFHADGGLDPLETLSAFSERHGVTWAAIRDRLPAQLHDVSAEVTEVFDAMEDEIAPLQSLLPDERAGAASSGGGEDSLPVRAPERTAAEPTDGPAAPEAQEDGGEKGVGDAGAPSDQPAEEDGGGLLEGTGLLDGVAPEPTDERQETQAPDGLKPRLPQPEITIPPLVEDLLPSLGLDVGEAE
ncbi:DUF5667 domain-containing protein [Streptomyces sp. DSM 44917]|uniref:DUF5667 domain-containing protein n=1 Tax=Streptomyces boetiae TaxID=3075541 RepID=A0ABU2LDI2_9ACTN|nr:DUF5667 domain-containing protein [Streptomyces sp. DSM 44917]MDT0309644.1 DUF5667 domain-containing protein [Streptomyces sp. DSM 44917]